MVWRQILAASLVALTLGCDRPVNSGPSAVSVATAPFGLPLLVASGTSTVTTTVFPLTPLTVPRGSTLTCIDGLNTPLPPVPIAGTVSAAGIVGPTGQAITMLNPGTFTFGCAFIPTIVVTIIVL